MTPRTAVPYSAPKCVRSPVRRVSHPMWITAARMGRSLSARATSAAGSAPEASRDVIRIRPSRDSSATSASGPVRASSILSSGVSAALAATATSTSLRRFMRFCAAEPKSTPTQMDGIPRRVSRTASRNCALGRSGGPEALVGSRPDLGATEWRSPLTPRP